MRTWKAQHCFTDQHRQATTNRWKTAIALIALGIVVPATAHASNPIRLSQVYGSAPCSGVLGYYKSNYVELFNNSDAPVSIGGWSVQIGSGAGPFDSYSLIPSGAVIQACGYYLISGLSNFCGVDLPVAPDLTGGAWINSIGTLALFNDQVTGRNCVQAKAVAVDMVGINGSGCYETAPAPPGWNGDYVLVRKEGGLVDTDDNSADMIRVAQPWPMHNSSYTPCPYLIPYITSVSDVPNDQGGRVRVTWKASSLDSDGGISFYTVFRRYVNGWFPLATVAAEALTSYSRLVNTSADSTLGNALPWDVFRIEATAVDSVYSSPPDSGYSVDNIAPLTCSPEADAA